MHQIVLVLVCTTVVSHIQEGPLVVNVSLGLDGVGWAYI